MWPAFPGPSSSLAMTAGDPRLIGIEIRLAEEAMKSERSQPKSAGV